MPQPVAMSGRAVRSETIHRAPDGTLICRHVSVDRPVLPKEPKEPECVQPRCIEEYIKQREKWEKRCKEILADYQAVLDYHTRRVSFAEGHRHDVIPDKYRTGEWSPRNKKEVEKAIAALNKIEKEQFTKIKEEVK